VDWKTGSNGFAAFREARLMQREPVLLDDDHSGSREQKRQLPHDAFQPAAVREFLDCEARHDDPLLARQQLRIAQINEEGARRDQRRDADEPPGILDWIAEADFEEARARIGLRRTACIKTRCGLQRT
jgi:hypothetical protein